MYQNSSRTAKRVTGHEKRVGEKLEHQQKIRATCSNNKIFKKAHLLLKERIFVTTNMEKTVLM